MKFWDTTIHPDGRVLNRQVEDSQFGAAAIEAFRTLLESNPGNDFREPIPAMSGLELELVRQGAAASFTYWLARSKAALVQGLILTGRDPRLEREALEALVGMHATLGKQLGVKVARVPKLDDRPAVISAILPTGAALMAKDPKYFQPVTEGLKYAGETEPILAVAFFRELAEQEGD